MDFHYNIPWSGFNTYGLSSIHVVDVTGLIEVHSCMAECTPIKPVRTTLYSVAVLTTGLPH